MERGMEKGELPLVKDNVIKKPSPQMWQHRIETTPDQPKETNPGMHWLGYDVWIGETAYICWPTVKEADENNFTTKRVTDFSGK